MIYLKELFVLSAIVCMLCAFISVFCVVILRALFFLKSNQDPIKAISKTKSDEEIIMETKFRNDAIQKALEDA